MKLHIVPARTGLQWVKLGVQTFWRQPMALTALLFISMMAVSLIGLLPILGAYLSLLLTPTVFLVMMLGAAEAHQGRLPRPSLALLPFRQGPQRLRALAVLGVVYALGVLLITGLTALIDDGGMASLSLGDEPMTQETLQQLVQQPNFQAALWSGVILYNLLTILMWHAPALVQWHGISPVKALFFSVVACVRNFRAFAMYVLGWAGLLMAAGLALALLTVLLSALLGSAALMAANLLTIMLGMGMVTMVMTSAVFTFRDCFAPPEEYHNAAPDSTAPPASF